MNTARSVWYGWGALMAAGGIAYGLAKRSIAEDRVRNHERDQQMAAEQAWLRDSENKYRARKEVGIKDGDRYLNGNAGGANPSAEASQDPAATRHAPATEGQKVLEKSKYEASEVWRAPKGGRFT